MIEKIVLGTVQFGLDYGVTNTKGQTPKDEVDQILTLCNNAGIEMIDTSRHYGTSENVIGESLASRPFKIITKIKAQSPSEVTKLFSSSLAALERKSVYGLLVHNFDSFDQEPSMYNGLIQAKRKGLCHKIGFSLYNANEIQRVLELDEIDLIQIPVNALDKSLLPSLEKVKAKGIEIHTRSPFLQGILANENVKLPKHLARLAPARDRFFSWASENELNPLSAALILPLQHLEIDKIVLGVNTLSQATEIIDVVTKLDMEELSWPDFKAPAYLLNPSNWTK